MVKFKLRLWTKLCSELIRPLLPPSTSARYCTQRRHRAGTAPGGIKRHPLMSCVGIGVRSLALLCTRRPLWCREVKAIGFHIRRHAFPVYQATDNETSRSLQSFAPLIPTPWRPGRYLLKYCITLALWERGRNRA